jgi:hypothetical protein
MPRPATLAAEPEGTDAAGRRARSGCPRRPTEGVTDVIWTAAAQKLKITTIS